MNIFQKPGESGATLNIVLDWFRVDLVYLGPDFPGQYELLSNLQLR